MQNIGKKRKHAGSGQRVDDGQEAEYSQAEEVGRAGKKQKRVDSGQGAGDGQEAKFLQRKRGESTKEEARLDNIARVLELGMICTTVCLRGRQLLVTSNLLHAPKRGSPRSKDVKIMQKTLDYFVKYAKREAEYEDGELVNEVLEPICKAKLNAVTKGSKEVINIETVDVKKIALHLLRVQHTLAWLEEGSKKGDVFYKGFLLRAEELQAQGESVSATNNFRGKLKITEQTNTARVVFTNLWRLVRDFKRARDFCRTRKITDYKLLAIGEEKEHAELRMLGYLLETTQLIPEPERTLQGKGKEKLNTKQEEEEEEAAIEDRGPIYLGISKLCCAQCALVVGTINEELELNLKAVYEDADKFENKTIGGENWEEIKNSQYEQEQAEEAEKEAEQVGEMIKVGGHHGLTPESPLPSYANWYTLKLVSSKPKLNEFKKEGGIVYVWQEEGNYYGALQAHDGEMILGENLLNENLSGYLAGQRNKRGWPELEQSSQRFKNVYSEEASEFIRLFLIENRKYIKPYLTEKAKGHSTCQKGWSNLFSQGQPHFLKEHHIAFYTKFSQALRAEYQDFQVAKQTKASQEASRRKSSDLQGRGLENSSGSSYVDMYGSPSSPSSSGSEAERGVQVLGAELFYSMIDEGKQNTEGSTQSLEGQTEGQTSNQPYKKSGSGNRI